MKKELPAPVVIAVAVVALLLALGIGFFMLNKPERTRSEVPIAPASGKPGAKPAPKTGEPGV